MKHWLALIAAACAGCVGVVQSEGEQDRAAQPDGGASLDPQQPDGLGVDAVTERDPESLPDGVPSGSRVLRLSHQEYDRAMSELLQLGHSFVENFPPEQPNLAEAYESAAAREMYEKLLNELVRSAEQAAAEVVQSEAAFAHVVGCEPSAATCRDEFIANFGLRAYRRPLSAAETARLQALFAAGAELLQSGDAFRDGVQLVLEAMLQSPSFLYRIERGSGELDEHGPRLDAYSLASRLSFTLVGSSPDAELLRAAGAGELDTEAGLRTQAARLADSTAFEARVLDFHGRWAQLDELRGIAKDPVAFPLFSPELADDMRAAAERFLVEATLTRPGAVRSILTAPFGFVNQRLAPVYGLSASFGQDLERVDFELGSARVGLFTQPAFLVGHSSTSTKTSPILRGVFVLRRLVCQDIPSPPANLQMLEPTERPAEALETTREMFTWKTSLPVCHNCHQVINPVGFAFEGFDGIGQSREEEDGAPVDSTGEVELGEHALRFNGARELLEQLATMPEVHACYAMNWLQYSYGRELASEDLRTWARLSQALASDDYGVRELVLDLSRSAAFTHLPAIAE